MSSSSKVFFHFTTPLCPEAVPLFGKAVESVLIAFEADEEEAEIAAEAASSGFRKAIGNNNCDDVTSFECRINKTDTGCEFSFGSRENIGLEQICRSVTSNDIWEKWLSGDAPEQNSNNLTFKIKLNG